MLTDPEKLRVTSNSVHTVAPRPPARVAWDRLRYQLGGCLLIGLVLPYVFMWITDPEHIALALMKQTLIGSFAAIVLGTWLIRSLAVFPGTEAASYILPSFIIPYGLILSVFLFGRFDYNRTVLISGFVLSVIWFLIVHLAGQRQRSLCIGIVPYGAVHDLPDLSRITWLRLNVDGTTGESLDAVVADLRIDLPDHWDRTLADFALAGTPVYHVKSLIESLTGQVELEHLSENSFGSLTPIHAYERLKYVVDWFAALALILLLSPVILVAAIAIKIEGPGPVFFRQARVGKSGRKFQVIKLRTMTVADEDEGTRESAMTADNDHRITKVGRVLRRLRIDELPQIVNILRGEMSWIGPRPEAVVLSRWYEAEIPFYRYRHILRPGITGWAQVNQGHVTDVSEVRTKLNLDFYYIKHFSPWIDILIVAKTIGTMLRGNGAR